MRPVGVKAHGVLLREPSSDSQLFKCKDGDHTFSYVTLFHKFIFPLPLELG